MAVGRVSFSDLRNNDDLSLDELTQKAMQEDAAHKGDQKERRTNMFDWNQEFENEMMETYNSNAFGLTTSDFQDAHDFLKNSKLNLQDGKDGNEIVGEAWGGEKYSLRDNTTGVAVSARSGSFGSSGNRLKSYSFSKNEGKIISASVGTSKNNQQQNFNKDEMMSQDLSDIIAEKPQVSAKAYSEIKQELQKCKMTIEALKNEKWTSAPPKDTIQRIILGKPYSLEHYKSLTDKMELLDLALKYHDGNAIMAIVLFLRRTLKASVFATQLNRRPDAFDHFIRYLEEAKEWKTLLDLYKQVYRTEDALILQYKYISKLSDPKTKLREIERLLSDYRNAQGVSEITAQIEEERKVLDRQIKIEEEDALAEKQGKNAILRYHPRTTSIPLKSLLTTLYYCALYHFEKPGGPCHPSSIKKEFKLTDEQYEWSVLPARAKLHRWTDISETLTASGWLKRKSERSQIGFVKVTEILHKFGAPKEILQKYIQLIENPESRLKAASSCQCHGIAIDTIVAMRDKQKLEQYRENVKFDANLRQRIQNLFVDNSVKWK